MNLIQLMFGIFIAISVKHVAKGPKQNKESFVQIMASRWATNNPLSPPINDAFIGNSASVNDVRSHAAKLYENTSFLNSLFTRNLPRFRATGAMKKMSKRVISYHVTTAPDCISF